MSATNVFDVDMTIHGARVLVGREPVTLRCLTESEVDVEIHRLEQYLHEVESGMKKAIRKQAASSLKCADVPTS